MKHVTFTRMEDGTREEYAFLERMESSYIQGMPARVLAHLQLLDQGISGYRVTRLEHSLQSATRAYRDNATDEMVLAALLHDIGDVLSPANHSEMAAALLRPFVSERVYWIVKQHGLFQTVYYGHHLGGDRDARDHFRQHPWYDDTVYFCHDYDQNSFDPGYRSHPLDFFQPLVERLLSRPQTPNYGREEAALQDEGKNV